MTMSKTTFHPREKMALDKFVCEFVDLCEDRGIPFVRKKAKLVLAYLESPFDPLLLSEVDVLLSWDVLSSMERDEFLECVYQHFAFLLWRQSMLP